MASSRGLRNLLWSRSDACATRTASPSSVAPERTVDPTDVLDRAEDQLDDYFAGTRIEFDVMLDPVGSTFQRRAWEALHRIPFGETATYGEQARWLGDARKARAVGAANGRNPLSILVPCHRVVGASGALSGFGGGLTAKAWLLDHERMVSARRGWS